MPGRRKKCRPRAEVTSCILHCHSMREFSSAHQHSQPRRPKPAPGFLRRLTCWIFFPPTPLSPPTSSSPASQSSADSAADRFHLRPNSTCILSNLPPPTSHSPPCSLPSTHPTPPDEHPKCPPAGAPTSPPPNSNPQTPTTSIPPPPPPPPQPKNPQPTQTY